MYDEPLEKREVLNEPERVRRNNTKRAKKAVLRQFITIEALSRLFKRNELSFLVRRSS